MAQDPVRRANGQCAIDLYQELRQTAQNLCFSPYCVSCGLAMSWAGARGETKKEIGRVLHFSGSVDSVNMAMKDLRTSVEKAGRSHKAEMVVANRLWGDRAVGFRPKFIEMTDKVYGTRLETLDFANRSEESRGIINRWVEEQTNGRIHDVLPPGSINDLTALVITSTIYFKGNWAHPFARDKTRSETFHGTIAGDETVPMMHGSVYERFVKVEGAGLLVLPYDGNDLSMVILLPDRVDGLAGLESGLTWEELGAWLDEAVSTQVDLSLPRFRVNSDLNLNLTLSKMGMADAFDAMKADFTGMAYFRALFISRIMHNAFIDVNEVGTEAAAAMGSVKLLYDGVLPKPVSFVVDHPFLFLIRERTSGTILFMGRVTNPLS